jgi:hypothetical protein
MDNADGPQNDALHCGCLAHTSQAPCSHGYHEKAVTRRCRRTLVPRHGIHTHAAMRQPLAHVIARDMAAVPLVEPQRAIPAMLLVHVVSSSCAAASAATRVAKSISLAPTQLLRLAPQLARAAPVRMGVHHRLPSRAGLHGVASRS